jgi:hypothetical protein
LSSFRAGHYKIFLAKNQTEPDDEIHLFKEYGEGYEEDYLDGNPTDVTRAY